MPIFSSFSSSPVRSLGTTSASKPGKPFNINVSDIGISRSFNNGAASVSFEHKGVRANFFTVTSFPENIQATGASSPIIVEGLSSDTNYTFTVTATNSIGTSKVSDTSASVTATTVPQAPTLSSASSNGNRTSVVSTFSSGASGGKAVSTFTTKRTGASQNGASSPITLSGLSAGTTYGITVTATNENGESLPSNSINATTFDATGGNVSIPGDGFVYHTFNTSGNLSIVGGNKTVELLLVAGGGGAGGYAAGGGGAGGLVEKSLALGIGNTYTITVGNGGGQSSNGGNSTIAGPDITTQTANGGGHGGSNGGGTVGGSGGGGSKFGSVKTPASNLQPNTTTGGFGNFGGNGGGGDVDGGGGGGGAGGAGGGAVPEAAGGHSGGSGGSGRSVWGNTYAAGGNGRGRFRYLGVSPIPNTGNGGSGQYAAGASGICRIRYSAA